MGVVLDLLQKMGAPPILSDAVMDELAAKPLLTSKTMFPPPSFTGARKDKHGRRMPQAIAHRGFKAKYPENTMPAFKGAVDIGVHALETDVHLTQDGVVVLSHDATLQRCFGVNKKLLDCEWKYVSEMRTIREPHEPMPRLKDLVKYLAQPGVEKIWLLLDIKIDNNPHDIMKAMSQVVQSVKPPKGTKWEERIILGCWAAKFIPLCEEYFPDFPITNIGFSIPYSRQFLSVPNVSFNMLQATLVSPFGRKFIRDVKACNRKIYSWTVNDEKNMDWCIRKELDGVITDDPEKFLALSDRYDPEQTISWDWVVIMNFIRINFFAWIFGLLFWQKHGFGLDEKYLNDRNR